VIFLVLKIKKAKDAATNVKKWLQKIEVIIVIMRHVFTSRYDYNF